MPDIAFLKPREVLDVWDVRPGDIIVDFGCGAGFFSIPLGQRVGQQGKIYAIDVRQEPLEATRAKAKLFQVLNVEPIRADLEKPRGSGLKDASADKVLITNILFQVDDKEAIIAEANRILKPGGSIMLIEWSEEDHVGSPVLPGKIDRKEAKRLFEAARFEFYKDFYAGSHHYGLLFNKK